MLIKWEVPEWRVRDTMLSKQLPPLKFSVYRIPWKSKEGNQDNFRAGRVLGEEDFNIHKVAGIIPREGDPLKRDKRPFGARQRDVWDTGGQRSVVTGSST